MKKKKYRLLIILTIIALSLPVGITFSRYVSRFIKSYIMEANNFFFNSDKLVEDGISETAMFVFKLFLVVVPVVCLPIKAYPVAMGLMQKYKRLFPRG